jgi:RNA polymerase sigma-70 factor (ECF subfamily)
MSLEETGAGSFSRAMAECFRRHADEVRRRLRVLGIGGEDALDIAQQTFVVAIGTVRVMPTCVEQQRAWLFKIAWHQAMNFRRLRRHQHESLASDRIQQARAKGTSQEQRAHAREVLEAVLASLSPEDRELLIRHALAGETLEELGPRLGLSRSATWARLVRAQGRVRKRIANLERRGGGDVPRAAPPTRRARKPGPAKPTCGSRSSSENRGGS